MGNTKTILIAPLHWGLGHATRCVPIIYKLQSNGYKVVIASDGNALALLKKEFPKLDFITLPSYQISYPKNKGLFKWKMLQLLLKNRKVPKKEKHIIDQLISKNQIHGIISDNRPGVWSSKIPSIYISHQLEVLTGITTFLSTYMHQKIIQNFDECWVPDNKKSSLSGQLGNNSHCSIPVKYIGILNRMKKLDLSINYDYCIILSGPEPQRTLLEKILLQEFSNSQKKVVLIQGIIAEKQIKKEIGPITFYNYLTKELLEKTINESDVVIARSGYTSLMDLAHLNKKAFFIPTPGQYEQEYLAEHLERLQMAPFCKQEDFTIEKLKEVANYTGMYVENNKIDYQDLFSLFERK